MSTPAIASEAHKKGFSWKRLFIKAAGFGAGVALMLAVVAGLGIWYVNRPKPPKPWNKTAITAEYDYVNADGKDNRLKFWYVLQNNTDNDFRIEDQSNISITGTLLSTHSLSQFSKEFESIDTPVFVPAHSRVRMGVEIPYPYPVKEKSNATRDERRAYNGQVAKYVTDEMGNLGGFVIYDQESRIEIDLPGGWTERAKQFESAQQHSEEKKQ